MSSRNFFATQALPRPTRHPSLPEVRKRARAIGPGKSSSVLWACLRMLYACVRFCVPTNPNLMAFVSHPDCSDSAYALFERMVKSPRAAEFRTVWLVMDPVAARKTLEQDFPHAGRDQITIVSKNTLRGLFWFLRSRYVFFTVGVYRFARCGFHQTIVNLWHGMPIKTIGRFDPRWALETPFAHYCLATSDFFAGLMAQVFSMPRDHVLVTGLPRNEWMFRPDARHTSVRNGRARLVVWLPTFRQWDGRRAWTDTAADAADPITPETLADLDRMLDDADVLLLLKLHPGDARNGQQWPVYKNIRLYTRQAFRDENLNVYKLLACSDALITDYSSVAIDYLLLRKPIGCFAPDVAAYTRGFMPGVRERLAGAGPRLNSLDELAAFIRNPPHPPPLTREIEELHSPHLRDPSAAILRAIGLGALAPAPEMEEPLPERDHVTADKTGSLNEDSRSA